MSSPIFKDGTQPSSASPQTCAAADLRILLVDDDELQRELVLAVLRHLGVRHMQTAADGNGALARLAAAQFDLVISDLNMPGMDGLDFLHRALDFGVANFAVLSAADAGVLAAVESALSERGANILGVLSKPLSMDGLAQLLARCTTAALRQRSAKQPDEWHLPDTSTLAAALAAREFLPYYQPKLDLATGKVLGVEVLARWQCPGQGLLAPARFIAVMEDTELTDQLTEQLLEQALVDSKQWDAGPITIAINLAPRTLEDTGLPERLLEQTMRHDVAADRITLELTETAMARDPQRVRDCAARLRLRGFNFAIDDFGTGYSSMALLLNLPFTELKIDRSFVMRLAGSHKARTMLEAMITLGNRLDMAVVAEGVETEAEMKLLRALGCPVAQGYLFAAPMSQADLLAWLACRPR